MKNLSFFYKHLFDKLKIKKGDNVVVHSNLSTFGFQSSNLPKIIIEELKNSVGLNGTIIMPLYTFGKDSSHIFDKNKLYKNKYISLLSEVFFQEKNITRSNCPIHSHIGIGKKSNILLKSNPRNTYGYKSDFYLMKFNNFKLLLLGCSAQEGATYFHQIEAMKNLSYGKWISFKRKIKIKKKIKVLKINFFEKNIKHNLNKSFNLISKKSKTFISIKNKYYKSSVIDLNELDLLTSVELKKNPFFLVKNAK